ncbi:hypothetical protein [Neobacillus niacini]|nr:hypothetical protein [Neobacillus niacini]
MSNEEKNQIEKKGSFRRTFLKNSGLTVGGIYPFDHLLSLFLGVQWSFCL